LPAFIAGAVGIVASAFSAIGGGGGGGGGGISSSSGSSFGNVGAQGISTPAFSSIPVNSDFQQNVIVYGRLDGNDILLSSQRSAERRNWG